MRLQSCAKDCNRRELSNAYLLAKFGFDTAENEPSKVRDALEGTSTVLQSHLRLGSGAPKMVFGGNDGRRAYLEQPTNYMAETGQTLQNLGKKDWKMKISFLRLTRF